MSQATAYGNLTTLPRIQHGTARPEIDALLSQLDGRLEGLRAKYPDDDEFAAAFAGEADVLDENVSAPDTEYLQSRLDDMLRRHNIVVPQDEPPADG